MFRKLGFPFALNESWWNFNSFRRTDSSSIHSNDLHTFNKSSLVIQEPSVKPEFRKSLTSSNPWGRLDINGDAETFHIVLLTN